MNKNLKISFFVFMFSLAKLMVASCDDEDRGAFLEEPTIYYRNCNLAQSPILSALSVNDFERFYKLVEDPATDINVMNTENVFIYYFFLKY